MKICDNCYSFHKCPCGEHGWCSEGLQFTEADGGEEMDCYNGPDDEPIKPHYQTETQRDNPRDPIVER